MSVVHYDDLDPAAQRAERERWSRAFDDLIDGLDLAAEFETMGSPYSTWTDGRVVTHYPPKNVARD